MNDIASSAKSDPAIDRDLRKGLTGAEAAARLDRYGPNALAEKKTSAFERLLRYFWAPIPG